MNSETFISWKSLNLQEYHPMKIMKKSLNSSLIYDAKKMKKMPFLIVERTLFLMYFKFMHEFRSFHFMEIIKFYGLSRHENHWKCMKISSWKKVKFYENHGMRRMKKSFLFRFGSTTDSNTVVEPNENKNLI